jgi:Fe-S-cluster containining protein
MSAWWSGGVQFQCQGSGKCCVSRGEYGYVFLTRKDRERMAEHLKLSLSEFNKKYCAKVDGNWALKEDPDEPNCMFLENNRCTVYEARPTQCRTWPFWPEVMPARAWKREVVAFCPGVGKGKVYSAEEIKARLREQRESETQLELERN